MGCTIVRGLKGTVFTNEGRSKNCPLEIALLGSDDQSISYKRSHANTKIAASRCVFGWTGPPEAEEGEKRGNTIRVLQCNEHSFTPFRLLVLLTCP